MSNTISLKYSKDLISKIRRSQDLNILETLGIIINNDGSVFDTNTKKQFTSVVEWSKENVNVP